MKTTDIIKNIETFFKESNSDELYKIAVKKYGFEERSQPIIITSPSQKLLRFVRYLEIKNMRGRAELKRNRDKYFPNTE